MKRWYWYATFVLRYGMPFTRTSTQSFNGIESCARDLSQLIKSGFFDMENETPELVQVAIRPIPTNYLDLKDE